MSNWELLGLYYRLGDGVCFDANAQRVVFHTLASCNVFRILSSGWTARTRGECVFYGI